MIRKLVRNALKCLLCGDVIESKHRHDWRCCSCGAAFVDGGLAYVRFGCMKFEDIEDLCEFEEIEES